jgi:hypothetical protein
MFFSIVLSGASSISPERKKLSRSCMGRPFMESEGMRELRDLKISAAEEGLLCGSIASKWLVREPMTVGSG